MTDTQQAEDSFGEVSAMGIQAETIVRLTEELDACRLALREENVRASQAQGALRRVQTGLQEGLDEVDDDDERELVCNFLNEHTQWEFKTTRTWRVTVKVVVTVQANSEDDAREAAENSISVHTSDADENFEESEVTDCELDTDH